MQVAEAARFLAAAAGLLADAGYKELRRKGRSRKDAESGSFIADEASFEKLMVRGVNRRDIGNIPIPELGYNFGLWSGGNEDEAYEFSGCVGNTTRIGRNCLLLRLPQSGELSIKRNESAVVELFDRIVQLSKADQGVVCASNAIEWVGDRLAPNIPSIARHG